MYFFQETFFAVFYAPIWWYSEGLKLFTQSCFQFLRNYFAMIAVDVWVRNLFVPMFGFNDWQSRIISFFMRFAQIIARSIWLFIFTILVVLAFILYLAIPFGVMAGVVLALI